MPILKSDFGIRPAAAREGSSSQAAQMGAGYADDSAREDAQQAEEMHVTHAEMKAAPRELEAIAGLHGLREMAHGMSTAIGALREINRHIADARLNAIEAARHPDGRGNGASAGAEPQGFEQNRAQEDVSQQSPSGEENDGASQLRPDARETRTDDQAVEANGGASHFADDLERRMTGASRTLAARTSGDQDEMHALLERAVGVMESLTEQPVSGRFEELKRRVTVLEQRVNNDRANARF